MNVIFCKKITDSYDHPRQDVQLEYVWSDFPIPPFPGLEVYRSRPEGAAFHALVQRVLIADNRVVCLVIEDSPRNYSQVSAQAPITMEQVVAIWTAIGYEVVA